MKVQFIFAAMFALSASPSWALEDNCTASKKQAVCSDESVKKRVDWACDLVEKKGQGALPEVNGMRYDCCGEPNYVWINDMHPKMVMHPIKVDMKGKDLSKDKDPDGKPLFVEFVKAVNKTPGGAWVDYKWTKFGATEATPKKSWVKKCKVGTTNEFWVVGSGTWQ